MTPRMMRTIVLQVEDDGHHTCDVALRIRVDTLLITYVPMQDALA